MWRDSGARTCRNSISFPIDSSIRLVSPVIFPPGPARLVMYPAATAFACGIGVPSAANAGLLGYLESVKQ